MDSLTTLAVSLGLGLLVGLQRQHVTSDIGGIRTFPMFSLFGTFCAFLSHQFGVWTIVAGLLAIVGLLILGNLMPGPRGPREPGQTTEIAALLTYIIGAYLVDGRMGIAAVGTGVTVVLLHSKKPLHAFVERMGPQDMAGIMQFVVVSLVILPLLPNRNYGPFDVLNPHDIWRMVVLIVGISLAGYIAFKIVGDRAGTVLGGILGGSISSTATTVSFARRTRNSPGAVQLAIVAVVIASGVAYVRVLIEMSVVAPGHFSRLGPPVAAMLLVMALLAVFAYVQGRPAGEHMPAPSNPAELKSALTFGFIYAVVLFLVAAVQAYTGTQGLYVVSLISGLTDMDAITLSLSGMVNEGRLPATDAWRLILAASLSNLVFKGMVGAVLGGWKFAWRLWIYFGAALAAGLIIVFCWPENFVIQLPEARH